jgi:hypothetical protein
VRVVCQGKNGSTSMQLAIASINQARTEGYVLRPSQPVIRYSAAKAAEMLRINRRLREQCKVQLVQDAVNASGNNDRIVIMPGTVHRAEVARAARERPRCNPSLLQKDASGDPTPSYEYQVTCPHDQNLVYVQGRAVKGKPLATPRSDRRGIPEQELGRCVRCNLQIEGSGAKPDDVIIDAGTDYQGTGPEARPTARQGRRPARRPRRRVRRAQHAPARCQGARLLHRGDRRHPAGPHEVLLERRLRPPRVHERPPADPELRRHGRRRRGAVPRRHAGDRVADHGLLSRRAAVQHDGHACDMRHSNLGYSGSMGNAVRITEQPHLRQRRPASPATRCRRPGHPGFPTDGTKIDNNLIYANNFNVYAPDSPVKPLVTLPSAPASIYPGVNDARVHDNWFFDNWRYGAMLFAVPDPLTRYGGPEGDVFPGVSCVGAPENKLSTSCGNHYFNNKMGQVPPGFTFPAILDKYGVPHSENGAASMPNGTDFWWDEFASNRWNCWYNNTAPAGSLVTGSGDAGTFPGLPPNPLPDCAGGTNQNLSVGNGDLAKEAYLVECAQGPKPGRRAGSRATGTRRRPKAGQRGGRTAAPPTTTASLQYAEPAGRSCRAHRGFAAGCGAQAMTLGVAAVRSARPPPSRLRRGDGSRPVGLVASAGRSPSAT